MAAGQQTGVGSGSGGGRPLLSCVRAARLPPFQCPLLLLLQEHYDYKDDKEEGGKERGKREGGKERKKFFSDHFPLSICGLLLCSVSSEVRLLCNHLTCVCPVNVAVTV